MAGLNFWDAAEKSAAEARVRDTEKRASDPSDSEVEKHSTGSESTARPPEDNFFPILFYSQLERE